MRIHAQDSADSTKSAADSTASPSEESKDEWKWEISGHWFQIRIGRNRRSEGDELGVKTIKGKMLNRTSSILRPLAERNGTPPNLSASDSMNGPGSNPSIAGSFAIVSRAYFPSIIDWVVPILAPSGT